MRRHLSALLLAVCLSAAGQTNVIKLPGSGGGGGGTSYTFNPPLSSNGTTVSLSSSGVASGSYTCLNATINTLGLITTATNGTCGGGGGGTVTHTTGSLFANQLVFGNGAADIKVGDLTGDVTTSGTPATTLATVLGSPGSYGSSSAVPVLTVDGKGRITAITTATVAGGGGGGTGIASGTALPATCTPGTDTLYLKTNNAPNQQIYSCSAVNTWTQNEVLGASGALSIDGTTGALDIVTSVVPRTSAANAFTGRNGFTISDFTMQAIPAAPGTGKVSLYANNDGTFHFINAAGTDTSLGGGLTLPLSIANGGNGTATPALTAGTNISLTGSWPNYTINSTAGGGSSTWNGITTPTANQALSMAAYTSTWTWGAATSTNNLLTLTDTANNTGTGYVLDVETASGSAANPIRIKSSNTTGVQVLYTACSTTNCSNFGTAGPNYYPPGGAGGPGDTLVKADNTLLFMAANTGKWYINTSGDFKAAIDNTFNIGAAGANRPATIYVSKRVVTGVNTVTSSATPTFDLSLGDFHTMTLTANVTAVTFTNIAAGHKFVLDFVQDATGSRTIAGMPAAMHGFTTIGGTASKHNVQEFYSPDGTNLYAVAAGSTNQ
jgi:hypothetical protein